jgi:type 1 fimbria pilin
MSRSFARVSSRIAQFVSPLVSLFLSPLASRFMSLRRANFIVCIVAGLAALPHASFAECVQGSGGVDTFNIALPASVTIPRDAAVGTVIAQGTQSVPFNTGNPVGVYCNAASSAVLTNLQGGSSSNYVMPIGNTGIGYKLFSPYTNFQTGTEALPASAFYPSNCQYNVGTQCFLYMGDSLTFQLVKMQPIVASQTIPGGQYYSVSIGGLPDSMISLAHAVVITNQSCKVTTPSIAVTMQPTMLRQFTGVGSTSAATAFSIGVDCTGVATTVAITFTDSNHPGNTSDALTLTPASTASGVGIQILRNSAPVSFGPDSSVAANTNQITIGASNSTVMNLPFSGRYIQTAAQMRAGSANGVATFTMSYQ